MRSHASTRNESVSVRRQRALWAAVLLGLGTICLTSVHASDRGGDLQSLAESGDPEAQHALALNADQGLDGKKDEVLARAWYRKAADQGYAHSRFNLALMLEAGRGGPRDEAAAAHLYQQAALQDFGPAQNNYGSMLADGRGGLIPNLIEAAAWLSLAVENGIPTAGRDQLMTRLTPEQRAVVPQRIAELSRQLNLRKRIQRSVPELAAPVPIAAKPATQADVILELKGQLDALQTALAQREKENVELQKDMEVSKQSAAAALAAQAAAVQALPDSQAAQFEIQALRSQIAQVEAHGDEESKRMSSELASLAAQLASAKETIRSLTEANQAFTSAKNSDESTTKGRIDSLQARINELSTGLDKAKEERDELRARLVESDQAVERQGAVVAELTQANEKLGLDRKALDEQVRKLRPALEKATGDLNEMRARAEAQESLAQKQAEQLNELAKVNDRLSAEASKKDAELVSLHAETTRLNGLAAGIPALQKDLDTSRLHAAESDKALEQQAASVAELTQLSEQLKADKASLQQQLQVTLAQVQTLGGQIDGLKQSLVLAQADTQRASDQAQSIERDRGAKIASLQQDNAALSARLRQAQGTLDQIAANSRVTAPANPGLYSPVRPGTVTVTVPVATPPPAPAVRYHTVGEGDSLSKISQQYYGTANRWQEIYEANRALLRGENALRPGQKLRIP